MRLCWVSSSSWILSLHLLKRSRWASCCSRRSLNDGSSMALSSSRRECGETESVFDSSETVRLPSVRAPGRLDTEYLAPFSVIDARLSMVLALFLVEVIEAASSHCSKRSRSAFCSCCVMTCSIRLPGIGIPQQLGTDPNGPWVPALTVLRSACVQSRCPHGSLCTARRWLIGSCGQ